jgi:hypothetical protein
MRSVSKRRALVAFALLAPLGVACAPEARVPNVNQPPLAVLDAPERAAAGERVTVDANGSSDLDGTVDEAFILFGDGTDPAVAFIAEHVFDEAGLFLIELYVHDDVGATSRARRRIVVQ